MTDTLGLDELDAAGARRFHHVPGLDGIRAVAVLLVIGLHYGTMWKPSWRPDGLVPGGYAGVDIFFVLSGFLITTLLVGEKSGTGEVSFRKFYARRALRLLPALYAVLVVFVVYSLAIGSPMREATKEVASVVFYVSNFAQVYKLPHMIGSGIGMTWSLAIEEQFYLVWPALLVLGVLRFAKTRPAVLWTIGAGALLSALIRVVIWNWGAGYPAAYMRPDARADGLLIGALCAFLWRWDMVPTRWLRQAAIVSAAFLVFVALFVKAEGFVFDGGFTLISLAAGVVILAVVLGVPPLVAPMEWGPMRTIGKVSYGLYLWQTLSLRMASHVLGTGNRVALTATGLVIMVGAVTTSWLLIEQPFLRLKKRVASPVPH
ncbi:MAG TPA: acyltransferase [Acidimicrobiales bacterium]|nr:acyltransferase [Acidimicrobiales bacterium]